MGDYIRVSTQNIDRDREKITGELEGISKAIEGLYQEMKALGSSWEGPAWNQFQQQVASDIENMCLICENLSGYLRRMEFASMEYRKSADKIENIVRRICI